MDIAKDGKIAYNEDSYRCYCDCNPSGMSQGYGMAPDNNGMIKVVPNAFADGIEGVVVRPLRFTFDWTG